jgi:hypothetical protein
MPIELMQVVTPDDDAVDLWLDADAALAIGLVEGNPNNAIYDVLAALKIEDEDEADLDSMATVRLTLDTESLELFLAPGALEELLAKCQAELVDGASAEEQVAVAEAEATDLAAYIQRMIAWFPQAFDGWVYNFADPNQGLAKQVSIGYVTEVSNQRDDPPSWDARAQLSFADSGGEIGTYLVTFMVQDDVPYAYLDGEAFAEVNEAMQPEPTADEEDLEVDEVDEGTEPVDETALPAKTDVAILLQDAMQNDEARREAFRREGTEAGIDDYDIYLVEPGSVVNTIGELLSGERGWWISPTLSIATEGNHEYLAIPVTAAKLLFSDDNVTPYIELPADVI